MNRLIITLGFYFSLGAAHATNFNDFCPHTDASVDCSSEFVDALYAAAEKNDALYFYGNEKFWLRGIELNDPTLEVVNLVGVAHEGNQPTVITEGMSLIINGRMSISGLRFEGYKPYEPTLGNKGYLLKTTVGHDLTSGLRIENNDFSNASEDLLAVWNSTNVSIHNNRFQRAGLADHIEVMLIPGDERPIGSGVVVNNIVDANIIRNDFYEIKKIGIYFDSTHIVSKNVTIANNLFDLKHYEVPTKRYGFQGAVGVYLNQIMEFSNFEILGNTFLGTINGVRINGSDIRVAYNNFNPSGYCTNTSTSTSSIIEDTGIAIKGHYLENIKIENNCIDNHAVGIALVSWKNISDVDINENKINDGHTGIVVEDIEGADFNSISIVRNELYRVLGNNIALRSRTVSSNNIVVQNTILQDPTWHRTGITTDGPLIVANNQNRLFIENNYLIATPTSVNWNLITLNGVTESFIKRNYLRPSQLGKSESFGGIKLNNSSTGNLLLNNTFVGFYPGIHDYGSQNKSDYNTFN
ncbi:hypothetical protein CWE21_10865 [Pseudidiomarina aquimaris]|uniref:Right handed beta helix domain-containing protein n=1 Tax=Pseudidiomarina aquimaris TaxID=641841 RepID=A0A432XD32_9GAMM|nr:right-handed parallel beta-helix repeat-containing protein [Pseudidiomarina aquimaris]RUO46648.1 hypothetical protein CWE21_10865 [Pseudidiomarina aquimaris]